jgi:hypothetical protein
MAALAGTGGCMGDTCPAVDVYTQRSLALDEAPEIVATVERIRVDATFAGADAEASPLAIEVDEVTDLAAVDRSYCGDTELEGHVAQVVAIVDVADSFTVELPARATVAADAIATIELESGRHLADVGELAQRLPPAPGMVAVGVEVTTDCADYRVLVGLWSVAEACEQPQTCASASVEPLGSFPYVASAAVGSEVGECV